MTERTLKPRYARLAEAIEARFASSLTASPAAAGEIAYEVAPEQLVETCVALRDEPQFRFEMLVDVCGLDYQSYGADEWATRRASGLGFSRGVFRGSEDAAKLADDGEPEVYTPRGRFAVAYHLLSIHHNHRIRLKTFSEDDAYPIVDSVISVWASANWFEREAFDLFGILFRGHPDLRRLLTDYGFIGHPFRKDFPLIGNVEMRYDPEKCRVVYEPVSIEPRTLVPRVIRDDARYEAGLENRGNRDDG